MIFYLIVFVAMCLPNAPFDLLWRLATNTLGNKQGLVIQPCANKHLYYLLEYRSFLVV
jgi:hypothetical protein